MKASYRDDVHLVFASLFLSIASVDFEPCIRGIVARELER